MSGDRERWLRLSRLFDQAIELEPAARAGFVLAHCADDPALAGELARMLEADAGTSGLDAGAAGLAWLQADADHDLARDIGARLGPWHLESLLGRGGMGSVYAARRDDDTGQRAAVKRLQRRWDGSGQAQRFLQERRILARLSHPNIPALLDHGLDQDGRPWFALEYVDGDTLVASADARQLGLRERIALFLQVCSAVQHAHERFVVHRDLKPANILVDQAGRARVLDFGVAKRLDQEVGATGTGLSAGFTPEYAAPEQVGGGAVTAATDVYALGVVLYQLLSGELPHAAARDELRDAATTGRTAERLDRALTTGSPEQVRERIERRGTSSTAFRRFVRGDLTRIVQTALAHEPDRRYPSVQRFAGDLQRFLDGHPVSVTGDSFAYRARKFTRRNRWGVAMGGLAVLALCAGVVGIALKSREAQAAAMRAEAQARIARSEARRQEAVSAFLFQVFSAASLESAGRPDISLREALDLAVSQARRLRDREPFVAVETLRAAANSYSQWDDDTRAVALVHEAMDLQRHHLPQDRATRGRLLALLAYADYKGSFGERLARARQALALLRGSGTPGDVAEAISILNGVLTEGGYARQALPSAEALVRFMRDAGLHDDPGYGTALGSLGNNLAMVGDDKRAAAIFEQVVRDSRARYGDGSLQTARDRMFHGMSLVRAGRHADALAPLERALPVLRAKAGDGNTMTQMAVHWTAGALSGLGRHAQALPYHEESYREALRNPYNAQRLASVAGRYATALARLGRCDEAAALVRRHRAALGAAVDDWLPAGTCGR